MIDLNKNCSAYRIYSKYRGIANNSGFYQSCSNFILPYNELNKSIYVDDSLVEKKGVLYWHADGEMRLLFNKGKSYPRGDTISSIEYRLSKQYGYFMSTYQGSKIFKGRKVSDVKLDCFMGLIKPNNYGSRIWEKHFYIDGENKIIGYYMIGLYDPIDLDVKLYSLTNIINIKNLSDTVVFQQHRN